MNPSATDPKKPADAAGLEAYNDAVGGDDVAGDRDEAGREPRAAEHTGSNATPVASNSSNYGASAVDTSASDRS